MNSFIGVACARRRRNFQIPIQIGDAEKIRDQRHAPSADCHGDNGAQMDVNHYWSQKVPLWIYAHCQQDLGLTMAFIWSTFHAVCMGFLPTVLVSPTSTSLLAVLLFFMTLYLTIMKIVIASIPWRPTLTLYIFLFFFFPLPPSPTTAADSGGHGPIQPTHPRHLGDQFPHLPVALPQSQPLGVRARQLRLPQPQRQAEGGMELEVT